MNTMAIRIIAAVVVASLVTWGHLTLSSRRYQPTIDNLNRLLATENERNGNLQNSVSRQNTAIEALEAEGRMDKDRIAVLEAKARLDSGLQYDRANAVLQERTVGTDVCQAASDAFDAELRLERAP